MILVTRDIAKCPQCRMLKSKLEGMKTKEYTVQDADSADGMATMAFYEVSSVPCLICDDDTALLGVEEIFKALTSC